jgi:hypothetical protein
MDQEGQSRGCYAGPLDQSSILVESRLNWLARGLTIKMLGETYRIPTRSCNSCTRPSTVVHPIFGVPTGQYAG